MPRRPVQHETLRINRGRLRTARKVHECVGAGDYEPDTGWSPTPHPIEIGEQYLEMRQVWPAVAEVIEFPYPLAKPLPVRDGDVDDGVCDFLDGPEPEYGKDNPWQEAIPMGSTTFRMCMECAIEDRYASPICP